MNEPEPAAPAVGDDEALHGALPEVARAEAHPDVPPLSADALYDIGRGVGCDHLGRYAVAEIKDLRTRLRAALADVARERERADTNLANAKEVQQKWCDESNRAIRLEDELDIARAALAAAEQEKARIETKLEQANEILAVDGREVE